MITATPKRLKVIAQEIKERSLELGKLSGLVTVRKVNKDRVIGLEQEKAEISEKIEELKAKLTNPEDDRLSIEEFLNLSKNAGAIIQSADAVITQRVTRSVAM